MFLWELNPLPKVPETFALPNELKNEVTYPITTCYYFVARVGLEPTIH